MSYSHLPPDVQFAIRDQFERPDAPVQTARSAVRELLGMDVKITVVWSDFFEPRDDSDYDLVLAILTARGVQTFLDVLREILNSEFGAEWTDTLLKRADLNPRSRKAHLYISIRQGFENKEPSVWWNTATRSLWVKLPKGTMPSPIEMQSLFKIQLLDCFEEPPAPLDGCSNLSITTAEDNSTATTQHQSFDVLPDISDLPRPDNLLLKPPYHLVVYGGGNTVVEVQCSHGPSLQLLAQYLKRWCKVNHQDARHPPAVNVQLHISSFSVGLTYDRLTLSVQGPHSSFQVSPMIVLSFVEGVLGYKSVSVDGTSWTFRRDIELRNLPREET
ncbi:hypothetical protein F5Y05DRAFT_394575 [Hypoxylon sp. FL0543]|nr:hypothetical protein F5Y05DRAFT_394575 [Hypoxylon sp. FL0543]